MCQIPKFLETKIKYKKDKYKEIDIVLAFINDERFSSDNIINTVIEKSKENIPECSSYVFIIKNI